MEEKLTRDPKFISENIELKKGAYYCKKKCAIEFPNWYMDKGMGEFGEEVSFYGIFVIIIDGKYSVSLIPTICRSNPINITSVTREGVEYVRLEFGAGDPILVDENVVQETLLSYDFFKGYIIKANVPWFVEPGDLPKILTNLVRYAGSAVGVNPITNELVSSFITRSKKDPDVYYRQTDMKGPFGYVPLTDLFFSVKNTVNKITGSYMQEGIVSALVKKPTADEASDFEKHLKG